MPSSASLQASASQHLLIFARHPELGKVKTRLAADIGEEAALAIYQELVEHTRGVADAVPVHKTVWLAATPNSAALAAVPDPWNGYEQAIQPAGDLGMKMEAAFAAAFAAGATAAVIIGTDCPGLTAGLLSEAYAVLEQADIVIGPAEDGGYYLLGMKSLYSELFVGKSWSTASVLADTLRDAAELNLTVEQLASLRDVDDVADLRAWRAAAGQAD